MTTEIVTNVYAQYGVMGLIIVAFFSLLVWVIKNTEKREDKSQKREENYIKIINTLSKELPEIREALGRIEFKIDKK